MNYRDFLNELKSILHEQNKNITPEEEYYRKLLFQVELSSSKKPSAELILNIFKNSLISKPVEFDISWYKLPEPELFPDFEKMSIEDELKFTKDTIKFFISDLRRLGNKVLQDSNRGLGITSSIGSRWYNYDIISIIYGYESFYDDNSSIAEESGDGNDYSWTEISSILLFGKAYE